MKSAPLLAAAIAFTAMTGGAIAQTSGTSTGTSTGTGTNTGTAMSTGQTSASNPATPSATTDPNQAVATTAASTATPAHGANSFTQKQARRRIAQHGFTQVKDLTKDDQGVWHGTAMQNGAAVKVWEDYKGSVGTE